MPLENRGTVVSERPAINPELVRVRAPTSCVPSRSAELGQIEDHLARRPAALRKTAAEWPAGKSDLADASRLDTSREVVVGPGLDRSIPYMRVAVPGPRPQKIVAVRVELADGEGHRFQEGAEHRLHLVAGVAVSRRVRVAASRVADSSGVSAAE